MRNVLLLQSMLIPTHFMLILMRAPVLEQILLREKLLTLAAAWIFHHIAWLIGKPK